MVSGVSFKNPQAQKKVHMRKKMISTGILFMLVILVVTFSAYGISIFLKKKAQASHTKVTEEIIGLERTIEEKMTLASEAAQKILAIENNLYEEHSADRILRELEQTIVPRVVLASVSVEHDTQSVDQKYKLTITGDVETFDALAAQIAAWKESTLFTHVRAGGTTRDEETGRLLFTVEMAVRPATKDENPYAQNEVMTEIMIENVVVENAEENPVVNEVLQEVGDVQNETTNPDGIDEEVINEGVVL